MKFAGFDYKCPYADNEGLLQSISLGVYILLIIYLIVDSMRAKKAK